MAWIRAQLCKLQKGCTRLTAASDKVYQLLSHGRWFSPGTLASSTTKAGRHDIAEILLKVALNTQKINQSKSQSQRIQKTNISKVFRSKKIKHQIFQSYHGEKNLIFHELMMLRSTLY